MAAPKLIFGFLGFLAALIGLVVAGFSGLVNGLALDPYERDLLIPPDLEAFYRQADYETGVDWAILAAWDGAKYGFDLPIPPVPDIYAELVQEEIDKRMEDAEEYCLEHPEETILCPPLPIALPPDELALFWGVAYAQWRHMVEDHIRSHAEAINPRLSAFWRDPESVYREFLSAAKAGIAAELFEGYLILDEDVAGSHDGVLVPPVTPPVAWEPTDGFAWPALGYITSHFGMRYSPVDGELRLHSGIDMAVSTGTPVLASQDGEVLEAGYSSVFGRYVLVRHAGGYRSLYAHNSALAVSVGETVSQGDVVAYSGSTGLSTGPHLHFEIHYEGMPMDPLLFLTERVDDPGG